MDSSFLLIPGKTRRFGYFQNHAIQKDVKASTSNNRTLTVFDLELVEYEDGLALQKAFELARKNQVITDTFLVLEHSPVITMGRGSTGEHIKATREELEQKGLRVFRADRGGDVTYHGPGQLVGYPIINLAAERRNVRRLISDLEEVLIRTASDFGVQAHRIPGWAGIWLGQKEHYARKLAALGVRISKWVTSHGMALNVHTDLSCFNLIVPCGIGKAGVTSLECELGYAPPMSEVKASIIRNAGEIFGVETVLGSVDQRTVSVAILRYRRGIMETLLLKRHSHRGGFWQPVTGTIEKGEEISHCAVRELEEETGIRTPVYPLGYVHSFLFGEPRYDRAPRIFQETGFWCLSEEETSIRLDSREHIYYAWVPVDEAIAKIPFPGLKETLRRARRAAQDKF